MLHLVRPGLILLRILIVAGALASVIEPHRFVQPVSFSLVSFTSAGHADVPSQVVKLVLTAVSLSLL